MTSVRTPLYPGLPTLSRARTPARRGRRRSGCQICPLRIGSDTLAPAILCNTARLPLADRGPVDVSFS